MPISNENPNILDMIVSRARKRVEEKYVLNTKERIINEAKEIAAREVNTFGRMQFSFEKALRREDIAIICEVKRASPSKGVITRDFPYLDIAKEYEAAGAAAISVLTEPYCFKGDDMYLREITAAINIPTLRKDFIIDELMIYEAKTLGASAVLLICAVLTPDILGQYIKLAHSLGLSALVETRTEKEIILALDAGARVIGFNNRDLTTFAVDTGLSEKYRKFVPLTKTFVSESGIETPGDVERMRRAGVNAVLVGETLMRSSDKRAKIAELMATC